jgi:hypothetical protein
MSGAYGKKWIHLSQHSGSIGDLEHVGKKLDVCIDHLSAACNYNIGKDRAAHLWKRWEDLFRRYDGAITSDTAPLSRIFLQAGWDKPLVIWVSNRFDYADMATNDCGFPDSEYYEMMANALTMPNVTIVPYTAFEYIHARNRGIPMSDDVVKPTGGITGRRGNDRTLTQHRGSFFIPPYHNDTHLLDLSGQCADIGLKVFRGRYNSPADLEGFKGIIHIPYAWSNLALFENWQMGLTYFIPSKELLLSMAKCREFFWSPPWMPEHLELSEWYSPENADNFVYFDSWPDLTEKATAFKKADHKPKVIAHAKRNEEAQLNKWRRLLLV